METQGYPLYARRVEDGSVWLVVGWEAMDDGTLPVVVPADGMSGRVVVMLPSDRFVFSTEVPTRVGGTDRAAELLRMALRLVELGEQRPPVDRQETWEMFRGECEAYLRSLP